MPGRGRSGQALVEFSLVASMLLLVTFGIIDLMRVGQASSAVAEAARQSARQAVPNAAAADNAFGSVSGACSGTAFTVQANGTGCLTDSALASTAREVLAPVASSVRLYSNTPAWSCPIPAAGSASLCIAPSDTGAGSSYASCTAASAGLGHTPKPGELGSRQAEYQAQALQGCFLVQVTVVLTYAPITPLIGAIMGGSTRLVSSTAMVAEY